MKTTAPSYADVDDLPTSLSRVIPASFEDVNGHMNVRYHLDLMVQAVAEMLKQVGLTGDYRTTTGHGSFVLEHHLRYFAEVLVAHDVSAHIRLLDRSAKLVHGMVFLLDRTQEQLASTLEFTLAHVDLGRRRMSGWPEPLAAAIDDLMATGATLPWAPPVSQGMGIRRS
jgi:acyl-CoA thioester hydrolase